MALTTSELTVGDISMLQSLMGSKQLGFEEFASAFLKVVGVAVDREMLRLTFELIDSDGDGFLTFKEFQEHIQQLRREEASEQAWLANKECFQESSVPNPNITKHLHHSATIKRVIAPPKMDSLITCGLDGSVRMWATETLEHERTLHYSTYGGADMDFDPVTETLAVATCDQAVTLYNVQSGRLLRSFRAGRQTLSSSGLEDEVYRRQFRAPKPTPNFTFRGRLAPELEGSTLKKFWNAKNGMMLQRVWAHKKHIDRFPATMLPGTQHDITSVCVCPHDISEPTEPVMSLFLAQDSGCVDLYRPSIHVKSGSAELAHHEHTMTPFATWKPHRDLITTIRREADTDNIITASMDSDIQVLNIERGIVLKTFKGTTVETMRSHTRGVLGFEYCERPKLLGSWGNERFAILWDPLVAKPLQTLHGHIARLVDLKFSPTNHNMIFTYSEDRTIRIWDLRTFRCMQQIRERPWETIGRPGAIHHDQKRNVVITATQRLYRKEAVKAQFPDNYRGHTRPVLSVTYCAAEDVVCSCDEVSLRVWDAATQKLSIVWPLEPIHGICLDSRGFEILVDVGADDLQVISTNSGQPVLVLSGTKPAGDGHADPRYIYWDKGFWIVSTARELLFYEDVCDQKLVLYPAPTFSRSLRSANATVTSLAVCGQRLLIGLHNGNMTSMPLRYLQHHSEEPLFLFKRNVEDPSLAITRAAMRDDDFTDLRALNADRMSLLPGPLHYDVRGMIKNAVRAAKARETAHRAERLHQQHIGGASSFSDGELDDLNELTHTDDDERQEHQSSAQLHRMRHHSATSSTASSSNLPGDGGALNNLNEYMNRVEAIVSVSERLAISSNGLGVLTLWDVAKATERIRWLVTLAPKVGVPSLDASRDGTTVFYGDDMGYTGVFDVSEAVNAAATASDDDWHVDVLARRIRRLSLFRVDDAPVASLRWIESRQLLCVGTATNNLVLVTKEGIRKGLLGVDAVDFLQPAPHTSQYATLMKMFRQEYIMRWLGGETRLRSELVHAIFDEARYLFDSPASVEATVEEMCPIDAERDKERLLDRTVGPAGEALTSLREKEAGAIALAPAAVGGGRRHLPPLVTDAAEPPTAIAASWHETDAALFKPRDPKPFRRNLTTHESLLEELGSLVASDAAAPSQHHGNVEEAAAGAEERRSATHSQGATSTAHEVVGVDNSLPAASASAAAMSHSSQGSCASVPSPDDNCNGGQRADWSGAQRHSLVEAARLVRDQVRVTAALAPESRIELRPKPHEPIPKHEAYWRQVAVETEAAHRDAIGRVELEERWGVAARSIAANEAHDHAMLRRDFADQRCLVQVIVDPEKVRRAEVAKQELRARRALADIDARQRAHIVDVAERPNAIRFHCAGRVGERSFEHLGTSRPVNRRPATLQRILLQSLEAPLMPRRSASARGQARVAGGRRRSCSERQATGTARAFEWGETREPIPPAATWFDAWCDALEQIPISEESARDKECRVESIVREFERKCCDLVSVLAARRPSEVEAKFQRPAPFVWVADAICVHRVTNPITTRCCGTLDNAAKLAALELGGISAFIAGQERCVTRIHAPLACVVRFLGHTYFCSSTLPVDESDAVPLHTLGDTGGSGAIGRRVVMEAVRQAFAAMNLEGGLKPVDVPIGFRLFKAPTGRTVAFGMRRLFPPQWNTATSAEFCVHTLRPELVATSSVALSSNAYDPAIPLQDRRAADRNATKAARRMDGIIAHEIVHELHTMDATVVNLQHGRIADFVHSHGIPLRLMMAVACEMGVSGKQHHAAATAASADGRVSPIRGTKQQHSHGVRIGKPTSREGLLHCRWGDDAANATSSAALSDGGDAEGGAALHTQLLYEEVVARAMRSLIFAAWRDLQQPDNGERSSAANTESLIVAAQRLIQHIVFSATEDAQTFWSTTLRTKIATMFPHDSRHELNSSDVAARRVLSRIAALCGAQIDNDGRVLRLVPRTKSIRYRCVFEAPASWQHHATSTAMRAIIKSDIKRGQAIVGASSPELLWLLLHEARLSATCGNSCAATLEQAEAITRRFFGPNAHTLACIKLLAATQHHNRNRFFECAADAQRAMSATVGATARLHPAIFGFAGQLLCHVLSRLGIVSMWQAQTAAGLASAREAARLPDVTFVGALDVARWIECDARSRIATQNVTSIREARDLCVERFRTLRARYEPTHPTLLAAMELIAECHLSLEEEAEAAEIHQRIQHVCAAWNGRNSVEAATYTERLGDSMAMMRQWSQALDCYHKAIIVRERAFGSQAPQIAIPHIKIAGVHLQCDRTDLASAALRSASHYLTGVRFDHPILLQKLLMEARFHNITRDASQAAECWTKVLDARERTLGPMHPATAEALFEIGMLLFKQRKYHEAWHVFDVCRGIRSKKLGRHHHSVAHCFTWMARCELALGDEVAASQTMKLASAVFESEQGESLAFPLLRAQLLIDSAALLIADVAMISHHHASVDLHHLREMGMNADAELLRALTLLNQAKQLVVGVVQDPQHPAVLHIQSLSMRCTRSMQALAQDRAAGEQQLEKAKLLREWSQLGEEMASKHDPLWYRKAHKIAKLRWDV